MSETWKRFTVDCPPGYMTARDAYVAVCDWGTAEIRRKYSSDCVEVVRLSSTLAMRQLAGELNRWADILDSERPGYITVLPPAPRIDRKGTNTAVFSPIKCQVCLDDERGELIDCDGRAGYRPCTVCT